MKKIIYSIAGALLFGMASCDSLNLSPEDFAAAGNYWQNAEQVGTYMNGLHSTLRSDYSSPLNLGELRVEHCLKTAEDGWIVVMTGCETDSELVKNFIYSSKFLK